MKRLLPLVVLLAIFALPATAAAQEASPDGRALAREFCAPCHAIGRRDRSRHSDAPPLRNIGRTYDLDEFPRVLSGGLLSGHPDMPQFRFNFDDARALRNYLRTIQQ
jgi:mono/diheme cytochrome c family protein